MTPTKEELQTLFESHQNILTAAVQRQGFRMERPQGGPEAVAAGLVIESDPTWHSSDDPRASNGYALTDLGRAATEAQGWTCTCAGHRAVATRNNVSVNAAIKGMCGNCQSSADHFGMKEYQGEPSCSMCLSSLNSKTS